MIILSLLPFIEILLLEKQYGCNMYLIIPTYTVFCIQFRTVIITSPFKFI